MTNTTWRNVVRGVALGDAWGWPVEFAKIESIVKNNPMGPDIPERLRITDDTQMTLYLAEALAESWDAPMDEVKDAIIKAYLTYARDPDNNRAPGVTVMTSLGRLARMPWQDATSDHSDGSGTVMRTSPAAFLPWDRWAGVTAFAAAVTHGTANGIAAALLNVAMLREIMAGYVKAGDLVERALELALDPEENGLLSPGQWLDGYEIPGGLHAGFDELARLLQIALDKGPELKADPWALKSDPSLWIGGGGWRAHETLVIALTAADMLPGDPMAALRRACASDGDSDTIGAVTGALLGALYPGVFTEAWDEGLRSRFEKRYVGEIEDEADEYPFADYVEPKKSSWLRRLVRR